MPLPGSTFGARLGHARDFSPEDEQSILGKVGHSALGGLAAVGNILDLPGSTVRDAISSVQKGKFVNPFDQWLPWNWTSPENRTSGRTVLRDWGAIGRRNTTGNWWGGLGAEIAFDPLTYVFPFGAASKGGQATKAAGLWDDVTRVAAKKAGKQLGSIGPRQARAMTTVADMVEYGAPGAREALETAAKGMGANLDDLMTQPLGGLMGYGMPFRAPTGVIGTGKTAQKVAKFFDEFSINPLNPGNRILDAKLPGTDVAPIGDLYRLFNASIKEAQTPLGRELGRLYTKADEAGRAEVRAKIADYTNRLVDAGKATMEEADEVRRLFELPEARAAASPAMRKLVEDVHADLKQILTDRKAYGQPLGELVDPSGADYFPRFMSEVLDSVYEGKGGTVFSRFDPSELERLSFLKGAEGATVALKNVIKDPGLGKLIESNATNKEMKALIRQAHPGVIPEENLAEFVSWVKRLPPDLRAVGVFGNHPMQDLTYRLGAAKNSQVAMDTVYQGLTEPGVVRKSKGYGDKGVRVNKILTDNGFAVEEADKMLAEMLGISPRQVANRVVDPKHAKDLTRFLKGFKGSEPAEGILRLVDDITNYTKGRLTTPWPAFHTRNLTGAMIQNWFEGMFSFWSVKAADRMMRGNVIEDAADIPAVRQLAEQRGYTKTPMPTPRGTAIDTVRGGNKTVLMQDGKEVGGLESAVDYTARQGVERIVPGTEGKNARRFQGVGIDKEFRKRGIGSRVVLEHLNQHADSWFWNSQITESAAQSLKGLADDGLIDLRWGKTAGAGEFALKITDKGKQYLENMASGKFDEITNDLAQVEKAIARLKATGNQANPDYKALLDIQSELRRQGAELGMRASDLEKGIARVTRQAAPSKTLTPEVASRLLGEIASAENVAGRFAGEHANVVGSTVQPAGIDEIVQGLFRPINQTADELLKPGVRRPANTAIEYANDVEYGRDPRVSQADGVYEFRGPDGEDLGYIELGKPGAETAVAARMFPDLVSAEDKVARIHGIKVPKGQRGQGHGQNAYLEGMKRHDADWYYNSQTWPDATNTLKSLEKKGLIELHWHRNAPGYGEEGGVHLMRLTEAGRRAAKSAPETTRDIVRREAKRMLGTDNPEDVLAAAGVPAGAKATIDAADDTIMVKYETPDGTVAQRSIFKEGGKTIVQNESLGVADQGLGTGLKMFSDQVNSAADLGADEIRMLAAGYPGSNTVGYKAWARMGVDAPLDADHFSPKFLAQLQQDGFGDLKRVSDFMKTPELRQYWSEKGTSFEGAFDVKPGSESRKALESYIRKRFPKGEAAVDFGRTGRKLLGGFGGEGTTLNPFKAKYRGVGESPTTTAAISAAGEDIGAYVEGLARLGPFIHLLRKGVAPGEAARRVGEAQARYASRHYTKFEQQVMSRLFPFYKFTRNIAPKTARTLMEAPGGRLGQTIRAVNNARDPDNLTPDYVSETASIPVEGTPLEMLLGKPPEGTQRYLSGLGMMFEDPLSFLGGGVRGAGMEALSRSNPLIKGPLEWITGESFFQKGPRGGRDLEDMDPLLGRIGANVTGRKEAYDLPDWLGGSLTEHALANSPFSRLLSSVRTLTDQRKGIGAITANLGTGFRVTDVSPGAQDAVIRERSQALMKDLGAKNFSRTYFPKDDLAKMTPEERQQAEALQNLLNLLSDRAKERSAKKAAK